MEQEYIKGDIVMYDNKIYTIMDTLGVNNYELSCIEHPVHQLELSGVPLTHEIIEKNGWKPTKESLGHSLKNKKYPRFALWSINDKWSFTIDDVMVCNTLSCLCYVHELQHLIFGLNINHEMKV